MRGSSSRPSERSSLAGMSTLASNPDPAPDDRRRQAAEQSRREHELFAEDPIEQALAEHGVRRSAPREPTSTRPSPGGPMAHAVTPLADDVVLFHAGFHKTGTTALQSAFASHREEIAASGVLYPGSRRSHHRAALAVSQRTWGWSERGGRRIESRYWRQVVAGGPGPGPGVRVE